MTTAYITRVTAATETLDFGWDTYILDASSNSITFTMQASSGDGPQFAFSRIDNTLNTVTIEAESGGSINGASTLTLAPYENVTLVSLDNVWYTIHGKWA